MIAEQLYISSASTYMCNIANLFPRRPRLHQPFKKVLCVEFLRMCVINFYHALGTSSAYFMKRTRGGPLKSWIEYIWEGAEVGMPYDWWKGKSAKFISRKECHIGAARHI